MLTLLSQLDIHFSVFLHHYIFFYVVVVVVVVVVVAGLVTTLVGQPGVSGSVDGTGSQALMYEPAGVAINPDGTMLYIADVKNNEIRAMFVATGRQSRITYSFFLLETVLCLVVLMRSSCFCCFYCHFF